MLSLTLLSLLIVLPQTLSQSETPGHLPLTVTAPQQPEDDPGDAQQPEQPAGDPGGAVPEIPSFNPTKCEESFKYETIKQEMKTCVATKWQRVKVDDKMDRNKKCCLALDELCIERKVSETHCSGDEEYKKAIQEMTTKVHLSCDFAIVWCGKQKPPVDKSMRCTQFAPCVKGSGEVQGEEPSEPDDVAPAPGNDEDATKGKASIQVIDYFSSLIVIILSLIYI